jgi:hypothetical protein
MFIINVYLRFVLIALGIVGGIALSATWGFWYGFPFILIGLVLLAGYLMLGTILSTNQMLGQQRYEEAEAQLKLTLFPKILFYAYRGVYFMTHGAIAMQKRDFPTAEGWLKKALETGLPSDNERGAAMLQLMMISAQKTGNKPILQNQLSEIKKLNITEPMLKEQIKEVEKQLKQAQQNPMNPATMAMMQGRGGFRQGGGKRPRPKMR